MLEVRTNPTGKNLKRDWTLDRHYANIDFAPVPVMVDGEAFELREVAKTHNLPNETMFSLATDPNNETYSFDTAPESKNFLKVMRQQPIRNKKSNIVYPNVAAFQKHEVPTMGENVIIHDALMRKQISQPADYKAQAYQATAAAVIQLSYTTNP